MQQAQWIPEVGEIVLHKESGLVFRVERRTRIRDDRGRIVGTRLWDCRANEDGVSFPLEEVQPLPEDMLLERFQISVSGKMVNVYPVWERDGSILLACSMGDRILHVKIPNVTDQVIKSAIGLAKFFEGEWIPKAGEVLK